MKGKSSIGLPDKMSKDDAYVQGMADGINEVIKKLKDIHLVHATCMSDGDWCNAVEDIEDLIKEYA